MEAWRKRFGERVWVFTRSQAREAGLFGEVKDNVAPRIGDVMIAARDTLALYDTCRVRPTSLEVVGQHGPLTKAELVHKTKALQRDKGFSFDLSSIVDNGWNGSR